MTEQTTATVETLTAEVRVLMVGNRQITLSIAKQLDYARIDQMEPFGRVRLSNDDSTHVIGRSFRDGSLVLARVRTRPIAISVTTDDVPERAIKICSNDKSFRFNSSRRTYLVDVAGRTIELAHQCVARCGGYADSCPLHGPRSPETCQGAEGGEQEINDAIRRFDALYGAHEAAATLPLIVLAGLR